MVVIDLGTPAFDSETEAAIRRRCRIVTARFDERNRPLIDYAELLDAVAAPVRSPGPSIRKNRVTVGQRRLVISTPDAARSRLSPRMKVRAIQLVPIAAVRDCGLNAQPEKVNHRGGRASLHPRIFSDGA